ncbi:SRPBCC family protein [Nonomuraea cavernae]|uniref:Activator of HSP90 ATPase n=1 Tax=Nonomuraea cavernae TaxID=2045107 RepID=A0A918DEZ5_9ACTN|nr:SRPBCC family protein [Nonomuraea cavernae]MCA2184781.1 SRPBCC family protein [Nonomuraea cavernae]GGO62768.1 activator of HSP90 ATPase [Nonomuraea cavernae]
MIDIINELNRARREVSDGAEVKTIVVSRRYDAAVEDVWDACTDAERIGRWFLPVTGDLRLGGHYQLKGNAGGEILRCEPPHLLKVSWVMGEAPGLSEVEVRLTAEGGDATLFELRHTAQVPPEMWSHYGPGAVGVGWDLAVLGLGLHLAGGSISDPDAWQRTDEARRFMTASGEAWGEAFQAAGAPPEQVAGAVARTLTFYVPETPEQE